MRNEILEKLGKLNDANRQLDFAIATYVGYTVQSDKWHNPEGKPINRVPFFTLKVDEAVVLARIVLKDNICALAWDREGWRAQAEGGPMSAAPTAAIALCIAVLATEKN